MSVGTLYGNEVYSLAKKWTAVQMRWGETVVYFSSDKVRAVQSFNRFTEEFYIVAKALKKAIASKQVNRSEFEWKGFINVNLTTEQKETYKTWDIHDDDVWDGVAQYCAAGYKINLSFNKQNDKFNCTGTGQPETGSNSGYAVSAFANTPYEAARVWLFKVSTILPDDWTAFENGLADDIG